MLIVIFMYYWFLSSFWAFFFVGLIKELRSIKIFLLWTNEIIDLRFIFSREVNLDEFILKQIRLTNVFGCPSAISFMLAFNNLFRNYMSIVISLLNSSFVGAIDIYFFKLSRFFISITDFQNMCLVINPSLRHKALIFWNTCAFITDLMLCRLFMSVFFVVQLNVILSLYDPKSFCSPQTTFTFWVFTTFCFIVSARIIIILVIFWWIADEVFKDKLFIDLRRLSIPFFMIDSFDFSL